MWQVIYIIAFAALAILAIANLVRNLILLGSNARNPQASSPYGNDTRRPVPHPELLDQNGQVIRDPLLVMRSISVKDAREQLDALYNDDSSDDPKSSSET